MKKILLAALLLIAGLALQTKSVFANDTNTYDSYGTFCSVRTAQGTWAVYFSTNSIATNCAIARRNVLRYSSTSIVDSNSGYYNLNGVNKVFTSCGFGYNNITTSFGGYALQNAVNTAMYSGLSHCIFAVNRF